MLCGDVDPASITRSPGSDLSRFRNIAQAPEWRVNFGPVVAGAGAEDPDSGFLSNIFLSTLEPRSHQKSPEIEPTRREAVQGRRGTPISFDQKRPECGEAAANA